MISLMSSDLLTTLSLGSRAFQAFDDFLLLPAAFAAKRQAGELGLAVPDRFDAWGDERLETLERRSGKWPHSPRRATSRGADHRGGAVDRPDPAERHECR